MCPPCWNIKGLYPDASLINYEQTEKGKRQTQRQASLQDSYKSNYIYGQEGKISRKAGSHSETGQQKHIKHKSNICQAGRREEAALAGRLM